MSNGKGENLAVLTFSYYAGGLKSDKCRGLGQSPRGIGSAKWWFAGTILGEEPILFPALHDRL